MKNLMERVVEDLGVAEAQIESGIQHAGTESGAEFSTTLTLKVSGKISTKKYIDRATKKPSLAKEYEIDYDLKSIKKQVEQQMLPVVSKAVGVDLPEQDPGSWLNVNFVNNLRNKEMQDENDRRWGRK